jgi:hypothetical protein
MADGDNPETGPLNIDQYLDQFVGPGDGQAEEVEETPEPQEGEPEAEATEVEAESEQDEPQAEEQAPEAYSVDEYGEITVELSDGTRTTLKDLAAGTLRQADYSRKTQAVAERNKALDDREAAIAQKERQLIEQFATLEEPEPDWRKLAEEDPLGWQLQRLEWEKKQGEKQAKRQQAEAIRAREIEEFRKFSASKAVEAIPEWADTKKFQASADARKAAALAVGFTEAEYAQALDFRLAALLEKAARYDAGQTKVQATQKKLANVPKVVKPGTMSVKAERDAAERAARDKRIRGPVSAQDYLRLKGF